MLAVWRDGSVFTQFISHAVKSAFGLDQGRVSSITGRWHDLHRPSSTLLAPTRSTSRCLACCGREQSDSIQQLIELV